MSGHAVHPMKMEAKQKLKKRLKKKQMLIVHCFYNVKDETSTVE